MERTMNIVMRKILKGCCVLLDVILTDRCMFVATVIGAVIIDNMLHFGPIIELLLIPFVLVIVRIVVEECLSNLQMTLYDIYDK